MVWIIRWFRPPPHVGGYTVPPNFTARLAATGNAAKHSFLSYGALRPLFLQLFGFGDHLGQ
jgi:hypothetical protein